MTTAKTLAAFLLVLTAGMAVGQEIDRIAPLPPVPTDGPQLAAVAPAPEPGQPPAPAAAEKPAADVAAAEENGDEEEAEEPSGPKRLFDCPALEERNISIRGWIDQGFTWNPDSPANRFNGPVTFNDRSNDYMLNQFYLVNERTTNTDCRDWDIGGRLDLIYGTDHRFMMANGLEYDIDANGAVIQKWNDGQRFYGLAMPQAYADLAYKDWVFRFGRFYTIAGYEVCTSEDNFFYSHSYTFQYGEPFTHTGMLAKWKLNDRLAVSAGLQRGWDQWEDINGKLGFLGGLTWTSPNERSTLALSLVSSNEQFTGENVRNLVSFVWTQKLAERWKYVFQTDIGHEDNAAVENTQDAEWYGLVNYLYYELNPCWSFGGRYEWFTDDDGVRVVGLGYPKGIDLDGVPAHWQEISLGVNYKPNENVIVRSELRWDWVDPLVATGDGPFDDYTDRHQFLWGTDLIVKF